MLVAGGVQFVVGGVLEREQGVVGSGHGQEDLVELALGRALMAVWLPKISSAQVGAAMRFRRPHELVALRVSHQLRHDDRLCCFDWPI
jgi:hypothetical protein